jgi:Caspase domain
VLVRVCSWKYVLAAVGILSLISGTILIPDPPAFAGKQGGGGGKHKKGVSGDGGGGCPPGLVKKGGACVMRGGGGGGNRNQAGQKKNGKQQSKKHDSGPKSGKKHDDDGRNRVQGGKDNDDKKQSGRGQGPANSSGNIQGGGTAEGGKHDDDDNRQGGRHNDDDKQSGRDNEGGHNCKPPLVYSTKEERCINPEPEHANCTEPYYYSEKHHRCVKRDDPDIHPVGCKWPLVPMGDLCACPVGTVYRNGTCESPPVIIVDPPRGGAPPYVPPVDEGPPPGPPPGGRGPPPREASPPPEPDTPAVAPVAERCLPQDLYDLLVDTYGKRPGLSVCPTPCLPKPLSYSDPELDRLSKLGGFEWCTNCLEVGAYMPLSSILEIERRTNLTICVDPSVCRLLPVFVDRRTEIRTIYEGLPEGTKNEGNIAVVVGNRDYQGEVPDNPNANSDADSVKTLLIDQLGYGQENIIDLRDGTLSDFERVFGSDSDPGGEIAKRIDKQDPEDVFVYVASHGMVKEDDLKEIYLLPVDAKKDNLEKTGYGLQKLYDNLGKTGARTTMLLLEANFAKTLDELINPPNLPELEIEAMPANPIPGLVVLKASDRDQRAIQDPEYGIGLFTRYAIEGFAGKADQGPIGNDDKRIDTIELYVYTADMVRQAARKSFGLEQKPMLSKIDNLVVGQLASN